MNNQFDELAKGMAQSVTRRGALKKFGVGLAGMALACFGLANKASAATYTGYCEAGLFGDFPTGKKKWRLTGYCVAVDPATGLCYTNFGGCPIGEAVGQGRPGPCGFYWRTQFPCSFSR